MITELSIGQKLHYSGDMANSEGTFVVTQLIEDRWGKFVTMKETDHQFTENREIKRITRHMVSDDGKGRFCTLSSYETRRDTEIAESRKHMIAVESNRLH